MVNNSNGQRARLEKPQSRAAQIRAVLRELPVESLSDRKACEEALKKAKIKGASGISQAAMYGHMKKVRDTHSEISLGENNGGSTVSGKGSAISLGSLAVVQKAAKQVGGLGALKATIKYIELARSI